MRIRSALLVACMVVVPMIAMFSHRVPAPVRVAIRDAVWSRVVSLARAAQPSPATAAEPAASATPAPPSSGADPDTAVTTTAITSPAGPTVPAPGDTGRQEAEAKLAALGATAIECHPLPGGGGHHAASCRVPVDATGQLHRLFQAAGGGPADAMRGLLADVSAWRQRLAARPGHVAPPQAGGTSAARTMDF